MKKVLALVLTSAVAVGAMAIGSSASVSSGTSQVVAPSNTTSKTTTPGASSGAITGGLTWGSSVNGIQHATLAGTNVYINKTGSYVTYVSATHTGDVVYNGVTFAGADLSFYGTGKETTSYTVEYTDANGTHTGIPQGVNGEDLLNIRISWDSTTKCYIVTMNVVDNPTVQIFENVTVTFKVATTLRNLLGTNVTKYTATDGTNYNANVAGMLDTAMYLTINPYASDYTSTANGVAQNVGGFTLANQRYTRADVYTDASGDYRINATSNYPVVDATAFDAAYGKKLIVSYPDYTITFTKIKNQTVALNLEADIDRTPTVKLNTTTPIMTATFHDIYVQDDVKVAFVINADAQNYKGRNLYAYYLNNEGKPITGTEVKVTVSDDSKSLVLEVKAGSRLAAYDEEAAATTSSSNGTYYGGNTIGIFGEQQETVAGDSTGGNSSNGGSSNSNSGTNANTGASDVVSVAAAFAAVSLAAAGFVAVNKASK